MQPQDDWDMVDEMTEEEYLHYVATQQRAEQEQLFQSDEYLKLLAEQQEQIDLSDLPF